MTRWIDYDSNKVFFVNYPNKWKRTKMDMHTKSGTGRTWLVWSTNTKKSQKKRHPWYYQFVVNIVHQKHFPTCSIFYFK